MQTVKDRIPPASNRPALASGSEVSPTVLRGMDVADVRVTG
jgi:hypothetical protein